MRFSAYMQEWLYGKNGYYTSFPSIGKKGDFATSVSVSMFFGGTLAKRLLDLIERGSLSENTNVVEIGAHAGFMSGDMAQFIYTLNPKLLKTLKFFIVEPIEAIREAQKRYFFESFGEAVKFRWVESVEQLKCDEAFIVSNELFDAFVCEVVKDGKMLYIENHEPLFGAISPEIEALCEKYEIAKGEIALGYENFALGLSKAVKKCEFVTFDYGQKFARGDISLRLYSRHKTYPFFSLTHYAQSSVDKELSLDKLYQKSDITYDVNFAHLSDAFKEAGFAEGDFCRQSKALVDFGLIDLLKILRKNVGENEYRNELGKAMQLIDPSFLGERFSMIRFVKGLK